MIRRNLVCLFVAASVVVPAHAIIRRHDREDTKYRERARGLDAVVRVGNDTGTLVAMRWVLTAAHVAEGMSPSQRFVSVGGSRLAVDKIILHPSWEGRPGGQSVDMALLRLARPVTDVAPFPLYEKSDEVGRAVLFVGAGMIGTGETGPDGEDGWMRAATNRVEAAPEPNWINFQFDAPPRASELEGISGPGDSGGPALIEHEGRHYVAGVSSFNNDHGLGHCRYGSTEYYARVSANVGWLKQSMLSQQDAAADDSPEVRMLSASSLPDTPSGRVATAFFRLYNDGSVEAMRSFEQSWRAAMALAERSVDERVARWPGYREELGPQEPVAFVELGPHAVEVITRRTDGDEWRTFLFQCEEEDPHKLIGINIGEAQPLEP